MMKIKMKTMMKTSLEQSKEENRQGLFAQFLIKQLKFFLS